jgi:predicted HicB family RNase H-like nuclease
MHRHHLVYPTDLHARAKESARRLEMSLAEFVRRAIEAFIEKNSKS